METNQMLQKQIKAIGPFPPWELWFQPGLGEDETAQPASKAWKTEQPRPFPGDTQMCVTCPFPETVLD